MKKQEKIERLVFDTYLAVITNSVGSHLFRTFYANVDGKKKDIMENGNLSCAFFVSSILTLFAFTKSVHGTVGSTVMDLFESGWTEITKPEIGCILVWEKDNNNHEHIGFYIGNNQAISNSSKLGHPVIHGWDFNNTRKITLMLWNPNIH